MEKEKIIEMRKAIKQKNIDVIRKMILDDSSLLNQVTPFGTFLHDAVSFGTIDIVKYFISCGIDVNKHGGPRDSGALTDAAFEGKIEIVKLLYENGAALDTSNFDRNPLFAAIYNDHFEVAKYLVEKGIDIKACYEVGSIKQCDACEYARQYGRTEIYNYLKNVLNEKNR
ncbi:ankyrin repeat domain-containing protein [Butyrivibrio hungatei]|uniref:Ankyrin repeat-containing protein n=1 Tax=Butyrivibrio hungatei TaxID=185008 RepID=A0A1D9P351_9FIRM|nr:ankyrin repeat domain-containing protein [Butyrivibrio hungatei]AOZ96923.1 ankyrin repeat-containing protein [Butyrivibrio hungatei]